MVWLLYEVVHDAWAYHCGQKTDGRLHTGSFCWDHLACFYDEMPCAWPVDHGGWTFDHIRGRRKPCLILLAFPPPLGTLLNCILKLQSFLRLGMTHHREPQKCLQCQGQNIPLSLFMCKYLHFWSLRLGFYVVILIIIIIDIRRNKVFYTSILVNRKNDNVCLLFLYKN